MREAECELALKHPIVYNTYNLYELASQNMLSDFSIAVLKDICTSLDLSDATVRRKKPYIDKVHSLCQEC